MSKDTAERWVTISALIVAAIYAYRRITEPAAPPVTAKKLLGVGELPPLGAFATAWGFTFLGVSLMAEASPGLGGSFAILIAAGDFLTNSASVFADVGKQESASAASAAATTAGHQANVTAGAAGTPPVQSGASHVAGATATGIGGIGGTISHGL